MLLQRTEACGLDHPDLALAPAATPDASRPQPNQDSSTISLEATRRAAAAGIMKRSGLIYIVMIMTISFLAAQAQVLADANPISHTCLHQLEPSSITREVENLGIAALAEKTHKVMIAQDVLDRWLIGCSIDEAKLILRESGFEVGENQQLSEYSVREGMIRFADAERIIKTVYDDGAQIASFIARIDIWETNDSKLHAKGYFYTDAP